LPPIILLFISMEEVHEILYYSRIQIALLLLCETGSNGRKKVMFELQLFGSPAKHLINGLTL